MLKLKTNRTVATRCTALDKSRVFFRFEHNVHKCHDVTYYIKRNKTVNYGTWNVINYAFPNVVMTGNKIFYSKSTFRFRENRRETFSVDRKRSNVLKKMYFKL